MKKLVILTLVLVFGIFLVLGDAGIARANDGNVWYFSMTNASDLVAGTTFKAEVYFIGADNGDPDVANDGATNLNTYFLDFYYNTDLLTFNGITCVTHYGSSPFDTIFHGCVVPWKEDTPGYVEDLMGSELGGYPSVYWPDDGLDPYANEPYSHMATIWFTADVTGSYDDLGIRFAAPDHNCLARVHWDRTYDNADDFVTWVDGDVVKCSWQYAEYVLHLGVDEQGNDYFPQELADSAWFTGPAAAGQTLRWIYGEPYDLYTVDQAALYAAYHNGISGQDLNTTDERTLIQTEKPVTSPSYAYNFCTEADDDEDMAIKRFIHWCDFNVQEYYTSATGINEPQVPSLIVTDNTTYGYQWKTLRGFATDVDPCDESSVFTIPDMEVHGLWLNDPSIGGLGYNVYLTGDEFKNTYEQVDGKYRSVCEPPEGIDVVLLNQNLAASTIKYARGKPNMKLSTAMMIKGNAEIRGAEFEEVNWEDVIPGYLMNSSDFSKIYSNCKFNGTLEVADLTKGDTYQLATFSRGIEFKPIEKKVCRLSRVRIDKPYNTASIVLLVNEETGEFRQATYTAEDEKYLSLTADEAVAIAKGAVSKEIKKIDNKCMAIGTIDERGGFNVRLVFDEECSSRFLPMYEVTMHDGTIVCVLQDGTYIVR